MSEPLVIKGSGDPFPGFADVLKKLSIDELRSLARECEESARERQCYSSLNWATPIRCLKERHLTGNHIGYGEQITHNGHSVQAHIEWANVETQVPGGIE